MVYDPGVYRIINRVTGRFYIGSTARSFQERWGVHMRQMRAGVHRNPHLQADFDEYGDVFEFEVVERLSGDEEELLRRERYYINKHWSSGLLYNKLRLRNRRVQFGGG